MCTLFDEFRVPMVNEHSSSRAGGVSGNHDGGFPARLLRLLGDSSIRGFARRAGVSDTFLRQCLAGRTEPTRTKLILLARAGGCSVEWLATGNASQGSAHGIQGAEHAGGRIDADLLRMIIETVEEVLAEHRRSLPAVRKALLISGLYGRQVEQGRPVPSREDILALLSRLD